MSTTRQPLLTEEQIQEMLDFRIPNRPDAPKEHHAFVWIEFNHYLLWKQCIERKLTPLSCGMDLFLAFLRGKTKRVLNIDRLRKDVKAWVADPNRKYPEWMKGAEATLDSDEGVHYILFDVSGVVFHEERPEFFACIIGINPDDYFEEVEVTE